MFKPKALIVIVAAGLLLAGCSFWSSDKHHAKAAKAGPVHHAISGLETATGTFRGLNGHVTTGTASIVRSGNSWAVSLGSDFTFDGAPDPWVGFGNNGKYAKGTNIDKLKKNTGAQVYVVPANLDVGDYLEVYVYCQKFTVPLGVAKLKLTHKS